jgi:hypothetical protein
MLKVQIKSNKLKKKKNYLTKLGNYLFFNRVTTKKKLVFFLEIYANQIRINCEWEWLSIFPPT